MQHYIQGSFPRLKLTSWECWQFRKKEKELLSHLQSLFLFMHIYHSLFMFVPHSNFWQAIIALFKMFSFYYPENFSPVTTFELILFNFLVKNFHLYFYPLIISLRDSGLLLFARHFAFMFASTNLMDLHCSSVFIELGVWAFALRYSSSYRYCSCNSTCLFRCKCFCFSISIYSSISQVE